MAPARRIHCLLLMLMIAGCKRDGVATGVSDSTYIASMVALLRVAGDSTLDSARRAAARRSVLQQRGLTPEQLERWARGLARDPQRATDVASEINRKVQQSPAQMAAPRQQRRPTPPVPVPK
jgi:hypothetical protein